MPPHFKTGASIRQGRTTERICGVLGSDRDPPTVSSDLACVLREARAPMGPREGLGGEARGN